MEEEPQLITRIIIDSLNNLLLVKDLCATKWWFCAAQNRTNLLFFLRYKKGIDFENVNI